MKVIRCSSPATHGDDLSDNNDFTHVACVSFDLGHNGDYDLSEIESVLLNAGYEVLAIDSEDISKSYGL